MTESSNIALQASKKDPEKVVLLYESAGGLPSLAQKKYKLQTSATFQQAIDFLRKTLLNMAPTESLFCFVNNCFQPTPDQTIGELYRCFQNEGKLIINYSSTVVWG